jgi:MFS transporter, MHS family, shikimate and dehydroshikimate transport protein
MSTVQSSAKAGRATAAPDRALKRIVVASVAGNAMEWYDFFVYGTAAALVFGQFVFPANADPLIGTLGAFARCAPSRMLAHIHTGDKA